MGYLVNYALRMRDIPVTLHPCCPLLISGLLMLFLGLLYEDRIVSSRLILKILGGFLSVLIGSLIAGFFAAKNHIDNDFEQHLSGVHLALDQHLEDFLEDGRTLQAYRVFTPPGHEYDAGAYLNTQIPWQKSEVFRSLADVRVPSLGLPAEVKVFFERHRSQPGQWLTEWKNCPYQNADLSWLAKLEAYDHWDLARSGPVADLIAAAPHISDETVPLPDFIFLLYVMRLRLIQGLANNDLLSAFHEVEKLGALAYSTETLAGAILALTSLRLRLEVDSYVAGQQERSSDPGKTAPAGNIRQLNRYFFAFPTLYTPLTSDRLLRHLFLIPESPVGLCTALQEALPQTFHYRPTFEPFIAGEADHTSEFEVLDSIVEEHPECRLTLVKHQWREMRDGRYFVPLVWEREQEVFVPYLKIAPTDFSHFPYIRRLVGKIMFVATQEHTLQDYYQNK